MMVLTADQTTAFFTEAKHMALSTETQVATAEEVLEDLACLVEFDYGSLKHITDSLRRPGGCIHDPNPNAAPGSMIPTPTFIFGAKSQLRLKADIEISKYYKTNGCELSVANMHGRPTIKTFTEHWKLLSTHKDAPILMCQRSQI